MLLICNFKLRIKLLNFTFIYTRIW